MASTFDPLAKRYLRAKRPLETVVGHQPTEPFKLAKLAVPKVGEGILSGMAICYDPGGTGQWTKTLTGNRTAKTSVFIAVHDQDQFDVIAAANGKLKGLDCSDQFEVRTGYYSLTGAISLDSELAAGAGGLFFLAITGDWVIGKITAIGAGTNNVCQDAWRLVKDAVDMTYIQFKTLQGYTK